MTIRVVPPRRTEALSDEEALAAAESAFKRAVSAQYALLACKADQWLFDRQMVNYLRLEVMREMAADQVRRARAVEDALADAMEALEATRDPRAGGRG